MSSNATQSAPATLGKFSLPPTGKNEQASPTEGSYALQRAHRGIWIWSSRLEALPNAAHDLLADDPEGLIGALRRMLAQLRSTSH